MLSVAFSNCHAKCRFAEYGYADCRFAKCLYAECRGARCMEFIASIG
jgi:hypothetical protein